MYLVSIICAFSPDNMDLTNGLVGFSMVHFGKSNACIMLVFKPFKGHNISDRFRVVLPVVYNISLNIGAGCN